MILNQQEWHNFFFICPFSYLIIISYGRYSILIYECGFELKGGIIMYNVININVSDLNEFFNRL